MAKAKTTKVPPIVEELLADKEETQVAVRCLEWCFLPGISHIGQFGLLQCTLLENHEGQEHQIKVDILSPPSGTFTINWTTGK